jgi:tetratricopeptide (TPR) repeat protein
VELPEMTHPHQLPIFAPDGVFADEMERLALTLHDTENARIVLVELDDPYATRNDPFLLRREAMAEVALRLFGKYTITEYRFDAANIESLPRFCRALSKRPICVFAYGLETLRRNNLAAYEDALALLNNQREDIRDAHVSVVLFAMPEDYHALLKTAPDFADWRSASVKFVVPRVDALRPTPLGRLSPQEADSLRRQEGHYREMLSRPVLRDFLKAEYNRNLGEILIKLGNTEEAETVFAVARELSQSQFDIAATRNQYLDHIIGTHNSINPRGIMQTERSVSLPLDEVYIALSAERSRQHYGKAKIIDWHKYHYDFILTLHFTQPLKV